jgi:hypothetical protein
VGGWTDPISTRVEFWDEEFRLLDSYDFGRLVEAVGWYEGAWYAQVSDSEAIIYTDFDWEAGSTLYRSVDGRTWIPTEEWEIWNCLAFLEEKEGLPLVTPEEAPRPGADGWARLGKYRFYLDGAQLALINGDGYGSRLRNSRDAIQGAWLTPHFLMADYDGKGNVQLTVVDRFTPSMSVTLTYSAEELEELYSERGGWCFENGTTVEGEGIYLSTVEIGHPGDRQSMIVRALPAGEGEEDVRWFSDYPIPVKDVQVLEDIPWSGHIRLLPYTGKDVLLYDRESGDTYASADGLAWKRLEGTWSKGVGGTVWTGEKYIACRDGEGNRNQVLLLDKEFSLTCSYAFPGTVEAVGYYGNTYYAKVIEGEAETIFRSADGTEWTGTGLIAFQNAVKPLR